MAHLRQFKTRYVKGIPQKLTSSGFGFSDLANTSSNKVFTVNLEDATGKNTQIELTEQEIKSMLESWRHGGLKV